MTVTTTTDIVSASDYGAYVLTDNTNIISDAGTHLFYIGGAFDTLTSAGNYEMVVANAGNNTIDLSGTGGNTVIIGGGNNVVNAGAGNNSIFDSGGTGDSIVVPGAASGFDNITALAGSSPMLDFKAALAGTNWDGLASDLGSYISATSAGGVTTVSLSATAHGAATAVASVSTPGGTPWDPATILTHVIS